MSWRPRGNSQPRQRPALHETLVAAGKDKAELAETLSPNGKFRQMYGIPQMDHQTERSVAVCYCMC
jgi:hypothetical protein